MCAYVSREHETLVSLYVVSMSAYLPIRITWIPYRTVHVLQRSDMFRDQISKVHEKLTEI